MRILSKLMVCALTMGSGLAADNPVAYPIGLSALERLELLPLLPPNGTQTKQFISYDTSGGNTAGFQAFKRYIQDGEWVFFDEFGPGCLYRLQMNVFWKDVSIPTNALFPAEEVYIRFRFDDEQEPRLSMTFAEFFGKGGHYTAPFTPPLAYFDTKSVHGGKFAILYHPFTFQKRLRISAWCSKGLKTWGWNWYQFTYLKFPPGTPSATWAGRSTDSAAWRAQWNNLGQDPKPSAGTASVTKTAGLKRGATAVLLDEPGAGSLTRLKLTMKPWDRATFTTVRLRMTWDDHATPDVDLPVGCFFGGGGDTLGKDVSAKTLQTLMFGYDGTAGTGYAYWPMPYWKRAKIEVINDSPVDLDSIGLTADRADMQTQPYPQGQCGYFGARRTVDVAPDAAYYSRAFYQRGYGKVVGLMMYAKGFPCDGDEFTYIDRSRTPQIHGDGTEDDHNMGFGGFAIQKPLWGGLMNGFDGSYRLYLADPYIFNSEIRINYEHSNAGGGQFGQETDFIIWYYLGAPGFGNLTLTDELDVGDAASEHAHAYQISGETWSGQTQAAYDTYEQGNPYPTTDHGRAFTNASQFTVRIAPDNEGVRLRRRLNRHLANVQQATVSVDGTPIPDAPWYFCDLPTTTKTAFADTDFEIPAAYTRGKKEVTIQIQHVKGEPANANNEHHYQVYCYGHKPLAPPPLERPFPPGQLLAVAGGGSIQLSWLASPESPAERYALERRGPDDKDFVPLAEINGGEREYGDRAVTPLRTYVYRMRAANARGTSEAVETGPVVALPVGTNFLRAAKASASSVSDKWHDTVQANDGDMNTPCRSGKAGAQWLAFQLPAQAQINTVVIYQEVRWGHRIKEYRVQVLRDGAWRDVFKGGLMADEVVCQFAPVTTDQIRIWIDKTTGAPPSFKEVQAFDVSAK